MTETDVRSQTAAVIPAYQDEKHIGDIVSRTREQLDHVLVIDDGSTDQTAQRAREAGAEVIVHDQNRGKGEAIKTGLAHWFAAANPSGGGLYRQIAAKVKRSRPDYVTGWIDNSLMSSSWMPTVSIFPKRSIGL